eukprot:TRINITY_DN7256_c0_g1_i1.p1 TRINITY_DN7256_c0_g1~~TRINITY_DN7256_c0_g1_i1.p1  ORF type:complete len:175 (-),score=14.18 TRINITY_DN7256_c0_g1_i1:443-946(-)
MIRRPPRSTHCISSAASDVYKRQVLADIVNCLLIGNLKASIKAIEEYLKKVSGSEMGLKEKKTLGQVVRYKFLVKILSSIHQLRKKEDGKTERRVADLVNIAVALRVSRKLKPNLYKLAVHFRCHVAVKKHEGRELWKRIETYQPCAARRQTNSYRTQNRHRQLRGK